MQGALLIFVGFAFLGQVYSTKNIIHNSQVNGTQGKVSTISTHIPHFKFPAENCRCQWLINNKTIENNYGRFKYSEDRNTGTSTIKINSTQRNDTGHYKYVCCDRIESQETFLYVIEFPSKEYPIIEFKVNNGLLVVNFITEKLSPIPNLTLNGERHVLYKNATHFWINKTVLITSNITNVTYVGVLYLKGYYRRIKAINGSRIAEYWNKTEDDTPPDEGDTPSNEKYNSASSTVGLQIAGVTVGVILIIVCLCISIYFLRKSRNTKANKSVTYTAFSGHLSINGIPVPERAGAV
ncbi:uncharacterized protein LOC117106435 [Anneissia japonica]|uniref:uncharacterized protein LOC117106435 n=1 Tax=Anneissia japonica TaxID=1529436 RepID=UPI0014254F46|nr:uncharacterized protein LOC117106435 [Anneissia japonica]